MGNKQEDIDFALLAESMIEEERKEIKKSGTNLKVAQYNNLVPDSTPDISKVQLDDSIVESLINGKSILVKQASKPVSQKIKAIQPKQEQKSVEELVEELSDLIVRAKTLITEMTTCGSIGVATIEPTETPKQKAKKKIKMALRKKFKYGA
jgi:hypothetical protein